jgi:hypothetical protein
MEGNTVKNIDGNEIQAEAPYKSAIRENPQKPRGNRRELTMGLVFIAAIALPIVGSIFLPVLSSAAGSSGGAGSGTGSLGYMESTGDPGLVRYSGSGSSDQGLTFANQTSGAASQDSPGIYAAASGIQAYAFGGCVVASGETTCSGFASFLTLDPNTLAVQNAVNIAQPIPPISGAVTDSQNALYVTGGAPTNSVFPLVNPVQSAGGGGNDAFVTVFAPVTRQIVFSTYIGGSGDDQAVGIALDPLGNMYIAGTTTSPNFPTVNAYQSSPPAPNGVSIGQGNSFIVKISSLGTIQSGPDFSLALAQPTVTASPATKVPITIDISRLGGLTGKITVTPPTVLPSGIKLAATPESTKGASLTFTIKVKSSAQPGSYPLAFTGSDKAGQTHTATLTLTVE